ncbi:MAG: TonB-dependent receptor [Burkholderiales bacterium]|nr:TonB-dependent receptor [Burkholderiales bacterium]
MATWCVAAQAQDADVLSRVVVSATRHSMPLADAPAAVTLIDQDAIAARGAQDVLEALRGESGVTVFGRNIGGRKALALRGLDPKHTLFLLDGRRISASDGVIGHTDFQLGWVPMTEVERIEVVRGPLASLYGAEAMGGVIQLFTRRPAKKFELDTALEGAWTNSTRGGDRWQGSAYVSAPVSERLALGVGVAESHRQAVASVLDPRLSDLEGLHKTHLSARGHWALREGQRIDVDHRNSREARWFNTIEKSGKRRTYESDTDIAREHNALTWAADWASGDLAPISELGTVLRAYRSQLGMTNRRTNGVPALRPNTLEDRALDGQWSARVGTTHFILGGFELRDERLENDRLTGGESSAAHRAAFVQDEWAVRRDLTVTTGVRRDAHERFGARWSPRVYVVWRFAPEWLLKGGYSEGFKPPTLKQITPGYAEDEGPYTYLANPSLRAERNRGHEMGVAWDHVRWGVQVLAFDNRVRDLIIPKLFGAVSGRTTYVFDNLDRALLRGAEFTSSLHLAQGLRVQMNYQYLDARDGNDQRIEKRPRHTVGATVDWQYGPWRASLTADSTAGQVLASAVVGQAPQPVPALTFVGAGVAREIRPGLTVRAGVANLTGTNPPERSPLFTWGEAPRTFRVSLNARW